jgi:tRNA G18 (ribose-2'-O)-methylase SpoU
VNPRAGRGFFAVGVWHPKRGVNVGSIWRTADNYGAAFTFTVGRRYSERQASDTGNSRCHTPLFHFDDHDDLHQHLPHGAMLVGLELAPDAEPLTQFDHPHRAVYLMGAEDHGLPDRVLRACHAVVQIESPAPHSLNVANAAAILLHHRHVTRRGPTQGQP